MKWIACVVLLALACGDDSSRPAADASSDARDSGSAVDGAIDAGLPDAASPDAALSDAALPDAASPDASPDAASPDAASPDASDDGGPDPDAGTDASVDAPGVDSGTSIPVQCRSSADCDGPAASCNREPPGGICLGCADGTCPSDTTCSELGVCIRDCDDDPDCAPGWECLGSGRCAIISGCDSCPAPYVCSESRCVRPPCPCPTGWTCESGLCMEP